jgi:hypothetical protein
MRLKNDFFTRGVFKWQRETILGDTSLGQHYSTEKYVGLYSVGANTR